MENIFECESTVTALRRRELTGNKGAVLWFTGLSGSGKSTIACATEKLLLEHGINAYLLDGDNLRRGLNADLGFTDKDRAENIRRIACVAALFAESGCTTLVSAISPFAADRAFARAECEKKGCAFVEIFVDTSLEECARRDVKGLYKKAFSGEIPEFTGVSSPYEAPCNPELVIHTESLCAPNAAALIADYAALLPRLDSLTHFLCQTAISAGEEIMRIYNSSYNVEYKSDSSPLTDADLAANSLIVAALKEKYSQYAILSEETTDDLSRRDNPYCFIVDPLDGTKEFVKRNGEFTVNIALTFCGKCVASCVYAPASDRLFYAAKGFGAYASSAKDGLFSDNKRIHVSDRRSSLTVMMSRSHASEKLQRLLEINKDKIGTIIQSGSSLKGCMIASGEADVYYRTGLTCEWDTAAMQCVIEQAGGSLVQYDGSPMTYNRLNTLNEKGFYILNLPENAFRQDDEEE